jgi:hypothetical protein
VGIWRSTFLAAFAQVRVHASRQGACQVVGKGADILGNGHVVVIENDQADRGQGAGVIERLEGHAGRERAVADDGHGAAFLPPLRRRDGHPQGGADRGAGVADPEGVVFALRAGGEGREPLVLFDGVQLIAAAGQHLVRVGLMAHIPYQAVMGRIEHIVQGYGELDSAQSRGKMPAPGADAVNQELAQFLGQFRSLAAGRRRRSAGESMD